MRFTPIRALGLALAACVPVSQAGPAAAVTVPADWVDATLAAMTLREKAGQMVWPSVWGDYVSSDAEQWRQLREYITRDKIGGLTISVGSPLEIALKLNALQRMSDVPLLVGADVEFGAGYRARGGYFFPGGYDLGGAVVFPPQMAIGATGDSALAYEQGRITASEGRAIGIHVAYAPILDVNNNPANPVINTRSYGEDPGLVARLGASFIRGLQEHGMLGTGKHFPGHGDTGVNSHLALPVVNVSRARLDSVELVPFRRAVDAGVGAIMSFHGAMPALDPSGDPGTLSEDVLTGLLRNDMKFEGLIISDAMDMRGVLDKYGAREAAIRAVEAGADVLIQPLDVRQTVDAVVAGVTGGRYDEARINSSVRRILEAKRRLGLDRARLVNPDSARAVVGDSSHVAIARAAAQRSITLVKDSLSMVPIARRDRRTRVLSITYARRADLTAGQAFDAELRTTFPALRSTWVNADDADASFGRLLAAADSADVTVIGSYVSHSWNATSVAAPRAFADFVAALTRRGRRPIVVAMGNPYLLQQIPAVPAYIVAWGSFPISQQAAARALSGAAPISGTLPITISGHAPAGAGLQRSVLRAAAGR
ncbi:MAG: hypothetical protein M3373_00040 [Gemmatimonadota bacterium]|nr:hypothetical protein [Gemmatimonadota bacterium]